MIRYRYKNPAILFIGINPHPGSFRRGVPFSNNKLFWYLLSEAGLIAEKRGELRDDKALAAMYAGKFNAEYGLGLVNLIRRPTRDIAGIEKNEELPGRRKISRILREQAPPVVCFVGKAAYERYTGSKGSSFGWQEPMGASKAFLMHSPLRGEAIVRVRELRQIKRAIRHKV